MAGTAPLAEFAGALRQVWADAVGLSAAEAARSVGVDEAVLAAALAGTMLPSLPVTLALVRACGADTDGWEDRWRAAMRAELAAAETAVRPVGDGTDHGTEGAAVDGGPSGDDASPAGRRDAAERGAPAMPVSRPAPPPRPAVAPHVGPPRRPESPPTPVPLVPSPSVPPVPGDSATATARLVPAGTSAVPGGSGPASWQAGPDRAALQPLEPDDPRSVGGYVLRARLGAGGMGRVYLSATPGGRPVALKVIRGEFADDAEFRRRFRQEVAAAQRVQGLYTAPVLDADADGPRPWLATAYVPGPTLSAAVFRHGPLPPETVLVLIAGVAEALQSVHAADVVHRDLKPSNVILAADGPRVIDFGIARAADATPLTATGMSIGTPAYMAPEQAQVGGPVGPAADVFSLGALAVYAATGSGAFGEGSDTAILYRVVHEEPDLSAVPEQVRPVVAAMLAKDPAQRPSPARVIELCREASGDSRLRIAEGWLPDPVAADVTARRDEKIPAPPKDPAGAAKRRRKAQVAVVTVLVLAAGGAVTYGLLNNGGDGKNGAASGPSTPPGVPTATDAQVQAGAPTGTATRPSASAPPTGSARPSGSSASASTGPAAGGVPIGGVIFEDTIDVPNGYCAPTVANTKPYTPSSTGCLGDPAAVFGDYGDTVTGYQLVLLESGETKDAATCSRVSRYESSFPANIVTPGSAICFHSDSRQTVGAYEVVAVPDPNKPARYWKIKVTVWRAQPSAT